MKIHAINIFHSVLTYITQCRIYLRKKIPSLDKYNAVPESLILTLTTEYKDDLHVVAQ